ncbi:MAG: hypothetical protein OEZ16_11735 [Chromatiales bacterium]|nr:hypothetical protein [Chromatiales bacterium]
MSDKLRSDKIYVLLKLGSIFLGILLGFSHVAITKGDLVSGLVIFGITYFSIDSTLALVYRKNIYLTMAILMPTDNKYVRAVYTSLMNILLVYVIYDIYSYGGFLGFTDAK